MTGDILRRLREDYGLSRKQVADVLGRHILAVVRLENAGKSWGDGRYKGHPELVQRQERFWAHLDALRKLCGKPPTQRIIRPCGRRPYGRRPQAQATAKTGAGPARATHQIELRGIKEWARIVPMHGTLRGFAWCGGEWVRAAWVEDSNAFQAVLLAARLPLQRRKTVPVQDATNTYHDTLRERGWR